LASASCCSRRVVGKERNIVPTGLLTGTRRVGQQWPVGCEQEAGLLVVGLHLR
jgi:hypothetical protein